MSTTLQEVLNEHLRQRVEGVAPTVIQIDCRRLRTMRAELVRRADLISVVFGGKKAFPGTSTPHEGSFIHSTSVYRVPPMCQAPPLDKLGGGRERSMEAYEGVCSGKLGARVLVLI